MLQLQAVNTKLLELLNKIMAVEAFDNFVLVGGTSLALQEGHRLSIDIDLFGNSPIDEFEFTEILKEFGKAVILRKSPNIIIYSIDGIKVDFVNYQYPLIEEAILEDNIRLASKKDIAAMKLNAISGRGSKKDFIDLALLLNTYSLREMMSFYKQKYQDGSEFLVIKSLTYFEDADNEPMPVMLINESWDDVKKKVIHATEDYLNTI